MPVGFVSMNSAIPWCGMVWSSRGWKVAEHYLMPLQAAHVQANAATVGMNMNSSSGCRCMLQRDGQVGCSG